MQADTGGVISAVAGSLASAFALQGDAGVAAGSNVPNDVTFGVDSSCSNARIVPGRAYLHNIRPWSVHFEAAGTGHFVNVAK